MTHSSPSTVLSIVATKVPSASVVPWIWPPPWSTETSGSGAPSLVTRTVTGNDGGSSSSVVSSSSGLSGGSSPSTSPDGQPVEARQQARRIQVVRIGCRVVDPPVVGGRDGPSEEGPSLDGRGERI